MGARDGLEEGPAVGFAVGLEEGPSVGFAVGLEEGPAVGFAEGGIDMLRMLSLSISSKQPYRTQQSLSESNRKYGEFFS